MPSPVGAGTQQTSAPDTAPREKTIVALTGLPFAGKSEVREQAELMGYPVSDRDNHDWESSLKSGLNRKGIVVLDNVRSWDTLAMLKERYNCHVPIVHVESEFKTRKQRANDSGLTGIYVTDSLLTEMDERAMELGLESLVDRGQITIYNGGDVSLEQLYQRTESVLDTVEP